MSVATSEPVVRAKLELSDLASKVMRQTREAIETKRTFFSENAEKIGLCCQTMAKAFDRDARLYTFGNGGSCSDALHMTVECMHPIIQKRPALPAITLTTDIATLTAIGNDLDFSMAYAEQLRVLARAGDIAMGFSTSGKSANVNRGLAAAKSMDMLTIGFSGRDGGKMPEFCDFCFTVRSFSIPRIQETQETLLHIVWDLIHVVRGEEDVL
jgi:D-sedoheptulose 7-phosphate isomerase